MNYQEIKEKESKIVEKFSNKELSIYIKTNKVILFLYSEFLFWSLSLIMFMLVPFFILDLPIFYIVALVFHLACWKFYLKGEYIKVTSSAKEEIKFIIELLKEIQSERKNK